MFFNVIKSTLLQVTRSTTAVEFAAVSTKFELVKKLNLCRVVY